MIVVMCLVMIVDVLLLLATARLLGIRLHPLRCALALVLDVAFMTVSCLPGFTFLKQFLCRLIVVLLTGFTAFGLSAGAIVFALLALSLGEISDRKNEILPLLLGAAGMGFACMVLGRERRYVPVELTCGAQTVCMTALRDTGNTLRDPITGKPVLIVGAEIAQRLTGLTADALRDPIGSMGAINGLRLIPYKTVGNSGFLLGIQIKHAKIGNRQGSVLVALSPQNLGSRYQALTGGIA